MYTPQKIFAKVNLNGLRWIEQDLATALAVEVHSVGQVLGQTRMVLTHSADKDKLFLFDFFMDSLPFVNSFEEQMTLGEWFTALGNTALPTTEFKDTRTVQAVYSDAIHAKFQVEMVTPGGGPSDMLVHSAKTDLLVTKKGMEGGMVEANCLASVAGFLHRTYSSSRGMYVMQGGRTVAVSNINSLGLISFSKLGGCKVVPIVESMLGGLPEPGATLDTPIYVSVPGIDWSRSSAMLVLLGHLIPLGSVFRATGDGLFEINLLQYPYLERFLTAEKYMDLSQIRSVLSKKKDSPSVTSTQEVLQRDFLRELLTISQSFIVVINSPDVYVNRIPLEVGGHPCAFFHHEAVKAPVVHHDGRLMNYLLLDQWPKWALLAPEGTHDHMRMHDIRWRNVNAVDAVRSNRDRLRVANPEILEIKCDIFE
jgi:hypothetical protein